jgi:hypothetical protein
VPDEITELTLLHCTPNSFAIGWNPPCSNNEAISCYNVYLRAHGEEEFEAIGEMQAADAEEDGSYAYEITCLCADCFYYVFITASNTLGEGYRPKFGQMVMTMKENMYNPGNLYVWGNNESSELGLSEETIADNLTAWGKNKVPVPFKNDKFDGMIYDMAGGNVGTLYACIDQDSLTTFLIYSGIAILPIEGKKGP